MKYGEDTMSQDPVVIVGMSRTPMGGFQGDLKDISASDLGGAAIRHALEGANISAEAIDEVIMGNILSAGQGQAPARQASLGAGIPNTVGCTTINKMCGSGMKATMFAADLIAAGTNKVMVAGGMESMTRAPYLLDRAREGYRMGHGQIKDHMFVDGLEDAYDKGTLMGVFAEETAKKYQFTREQQDDFAITSLNRAKAAIEDGSFVSEITPVIAKTRKGDKVITTDEQPLKADIEKIKQLRPAFAKDGSVTAANSSSISDGGAALVLMTLSEAKRRSLNPLAVIRGHSTFAHEPAWFTTAPSPAIEKLLQKIQWLKDDVDLFEINEAFAVVTMAAMRDLDIPHEKVNIHGGACALGHPVGASGARIIVTLLAALKKNNMSKGIAALCIGGGEATAIAVERIH